MGAITEATVLQGQRSPIRESAEAPSLYSSNFM